MKKKYYLALVLPCILLCLLAAGSRTDALDGPTPERVCFLSCQSNFFRPEEPVSRGEAAQILYGLLEGEAEPQEEENAGFSDVRPGSEYFDSVRTVSALGLMQGYGDGTFRPEKSIARGELAVVLCRLMGMGEARPLPYQEDRGDAYWGTAEVKALVREGWISGYGDGEVYPDRPVTRAEAAVMINRMRGRAPNRQVIDLVCRDRPYMDVPRDHWAYYDIIDAAWESELLSCATGHKARGPGLVLLDGQLCHVNETLRLDCYAAGFHTVEGGLYYAAEDGFALSRYQAGLIELDGAMFYVEKEDGPFAADYDLGPLHFGPDGRYTSGDKTVDAYVDAILEDILADSSATREEKLRAAYLTIRDGGYSYMTRNTGWVRGSTGWELGCARVMYETKRGSCYYWAAAFLYLARRLGYPAYPVCGGVNQYNDLHAWVVIPWDDGEEYIFDVELDWGYRTGGGGRYPIRYGRDLFKQPRSSPVLHYIFPDNTSRRDGDWYES